MLWKMPWTSGKLCKKMGNQIFFKIYVSIWIRLDDGRTPYFKLFSFSNWRKLQTSTSWNHIPIKTSTEFTTPHGTEVTWYFRTREMLNYRWLKKSKYDHHWRTSNTKKEDTYIRQLRKVNFLRGTWQVDWFLHILMTPRHQQGHIFHTH